MNKFEQVRGMGWGPMSSITWGPPPPNRKTRVKTLPSRTLGMRVVKIDMQSNDYFCSMAFNGHMENACAVMQKLCE